MGWKTWRDRVTAARIVRRALEPWATAAARQHLNELDQQDPKRAEELALRELVHRGRATPFGRAHDFGRIASHRDFQRLVPLRSLSQLRDEYEFAQVGHRSATWPTPVVSLVALQPGDEPFPLTAELIRSHRQATLTTLGLAMHACRPVRPFAGRWLVLPNSIFAHTLTGLACSFAWCPPPELDPEALIEEAIGSAITGVAGTSEVLERWVGQVQQLTGADRLIDVWPTLRMVLCEAGGRDRPCALRRGVLSDGPAVLETHGHLYAPMAVEDPRHGALRLLTNVGIFFEFIPQEELGSSRPRRYDLSAIEPGIVYQVAVSAPGVWACLIGARVSFEKRDPPLLRIRTEAGSVATSIIPSRVHHPAFQTPHRPRPVLSQTE